MKLQNNFKKDELKRWFMDNWECWWCKQNHIDCFHHIVGRGFKGSKCESSILNACPINNFDCHLSQHGKLRTDKYVKILLQKTMRYLLKQGYKLKEIDIEFYKRYEKYYN